MKDCRFISAGLHGLLIFKLSYINYLLWHSSEYSIAKLLVYSRYRVNPKLGDIKYQLLVFEYRRLKRTTSYPLFCATPSQSMI